MWKRWWDITDDSHNIQGVIRKGTLGVSGRDAKDIVS